MAEIKKYSEKYRADVERICLETGPKEALTDKKTGDYILATYCHYYIDNEPDNCFVLTDDDDRCRGYILCAENFGKFRKGSKPYRKSIKEAGLSNAVECRSEVLGHWLFSKKYPAHLHIDIDAGFRGNGNGTKMIQTLMSHLKEKGVRGVCLFCGYGNVEAIRFYKRNGFRPALNVMNQALAMVKEL